MSSVWRVNEVRSCETCKEPYRAEKNTRRYCSIRCAHVPRRKPVEERPLLECEVCSEKFSGRLKKQRYCSKVCQYRGAAIQSYGITVARYRKMLVEQDNSCASCRADFDGIRICIDHSHESGMVRGLLCSGCNIAAGHIEKRGDEVSAYLARHSFDLLSLCG